MNNDEPKFSDLIGKTLIKIVGSNGAETIDFHVSDNEIYRLYHSQDCCESVSVEDICGELQDLVGSPIVQAEENSNASEPKDYKREYALESATWTFYRIATKKGQVVIRWLGESNGYYSEAVDFCKL